MASALLRGGLTVAAPSAGGGSWFALEAVVVGIMSVEVFAGGIVAVCTMFVTGGAASAVALAGETAAAGLLPRTALGAGLWLFALACNCTCLPR